MERIGSHGIIDETFALADALLDIDHKLMVVLVLLFDHVFGFEQLVCLLFDNDSLLWSDMLFHGEWYLSQIVR